MKASDNPYPSILVEEATEPSAPAAGHQRLYIDSTSHKLKRTDSSGTDVTIEGGGIEDEGAFTFLDATEAAAPATPSSGYVRIYAKTDGRIYSKDDAGTEYGPFDEAGGGGADLSSFRLASVADDPTEIPLGTYGDEFEYETASAFTTAGWTATGSLTAYRVAGSEIIYACGGTSGRGFYLDAGGNLPDDFEVAVLLSAIPDQLNMTGIGILDSSGNGIGFSMYSSGNGADLWNVTAYAYASTLSQNNTNYLTAAQSATPHWLALRRSSATTWRARYSVDGATWTTAHAAQSKTVTNARRIYVGSFYNGGVDYQYGSIHRLVYGTADLGL